MKSTTFAAALLASVAVAQPQHGHQRRHKHQDELEKRELVVEWETVWETATVYVDETTTETVLPEKTPEVESAATTISTGVPGQFFQTPSEQPTTLATSTSSAAPPPPPAEITTEAPPAPTTTSTTSTPQPEPTTAAAPIISVPPIAVPPPVVATTSSPAEEPTTSSAPPPAETSSSGGGGGSGGGSTGVSGKGDITYYTVGMGACGYDDTGADDSENIVAMPVGMWTAVSSATNLGIDMPAHPWCDKTITITANGKSVQAKIRDQCPGCSGGSIDVTAHAFLALFGSLDGGRETVEWTLDS